jgi:hypothetical protein
MMQRLPYNLLKRLLARKASLVWMLGASLWLWTVSSSSPLIAGDPVVEAIRSFAVGEDLRDLQDPPKTVTAEITDSRILDITEVRVGLNLVGVSSGAGFASEMVVSLNKDFSATAMLLNKVGVTLADGAGFGYDGWDVTFRDSASAGDVHTLEWPSGVMTGEVQPDGRVLPESSDRPARLSALNGQVGNGTWRLSVADLHLGGTMRLESWSLTLVGKTNRAPTFVGLVDASIPESAEYRLPLVGRDADLPAQNLTITLVDGPVGAVVSAGEFRWTPPETAGGTTNTVRLSITDGVDSTVASVRLTVTEANQVPVFTGLSDVVLTNLSPYTLTLMATDADVPVQSLTYVLVGGPEGSEVTGNTFAWTPFEEQRPSTNRVQIAVSDGLGAVTNQFLIRLPAINTPPQLVAVANRTLREGVALGFNLLAADADIPANGLTYGLVSGPSGLTVSPSGRVAWVPSEAQGSGIYTVTVKVEDDGYPVLADSETFQLTVTEVNLPPQIDPLSNVDHNEGAPLSLLLKAVDLDLPAQTLTFSLISGPSGMTLAQGGLLQWTPTELQGPSRQVVQVRATDSSGDYAESEFLVNVLEVANPPVLPDLGTFTLNEMVAWSRVLGGSDPDLPAQSLTYGLVSGPSGLTVSSDGRLAWTPTEAQGPGTYTAVVRITDDTDLSTERGYPITVSEVNRVPVLATVASQSVGEGIELFVSLVGSDADLPSNSLTYALVQGPVGMVVDRVSGQLRWTPSETQGPSTNTIIVSVTDDASPALTSQTTFRVTVSEVNRSPALAPVEDQRVTERQTLLVNLAGSDPDVPSNVVRYRLVSAPSGMQVNTITGRITWTPTSDQGPATYTVIAEVYDDAETSLAGQLSFQVIVMDSNRAPIATAQNLTGSEEVSMSIRLAATDADGDPLTYFIVTPPTRGTLAGFPPNLTYIPAANAFGSDSFTFRVNDGTTDSEISSVSISLAGVNDPPVAQGGKVSLDEDIQTQLELKASDVDGDTLNYTVVDQPTRGVLTGSGAFRQYLPNQNYTGSDSFTFKVNDGTVDSAVVTMLISIAAVNDAPVAVAQSVTLDEDKSVAITLVGSDVEGSDLTYSVVDPPTKGVLSGTAPNLTYTPNANANGIDSFTFKVNDGALDSAVATVSMGITAVNDAPVAVAQTVVAIKNTARTLVLGGMDADGDALTFTLLTPPAHGVLTGEGESRTYTPKPRYVGNDAFTFKVNDGSLDSPVATVAVVVQDKNDPPSAVAQSVAVIEDVAKLVTLTGTDPDKNSLTYIVVDLPTKGVLSGTAPNLTYTPKANANGADSFTFKVNDGALDSVVATVSIGITAVNDAPVAVAQSVTTDEDKSRAITLAGTDPDENSLTYTVVGLPTKGVLSGTAPNLTYTPNANANGIDSFTFKVNDGALDSAVATVSMGITAVNDAPVAVAQSVTMEEDKSQTITLAGSDVEGSALTYTVVVPPTRGALSGTAPNLTYTPNANANGSDSFTFKVNDGALDSAVATVTFKVGPVNDPPILDPLINSVLDSGVGLFFQATGFDIDVPAQSLNFTLKSGPSGMSVSSAGLVAWLPTASQRPSTNAVVLQLSDGIASVEGSFRVEAKAAKQSTRFAGAAIDGYIVGATVWFDADFDGTQDPEEPHTVTDREGDFDFNFDSSLLDKNNNGTLDPSEGRLVVEGGVDLSTGQPRVGQLTAPSGSKVITPLTTMVDLVSRQGTGLSTAEAEERVRTALGIPEGISMTTYDPVAAAVNGDSRAASVQVAASSVADTIGLLASVIDGASGSMNAQQSSVVLSQTLASKLAAGTAVDLSSSTALKATLTAAAAKVGTALPAEVTKIASQVVAEQNSAKAYVLSSTWNSLDALRSIAQVQAVSQAGALSALSDLGAGAVSADEVSLLYTGDALSQAVALAPVGDLTGTDRRPGVFEVSTISAVVTEGGRSIQPLIVARHDGAYGAVRLQVRLQGDAQLLVTNAITVDFPDAVTQQVVDLSPALRDDADPRPDRWITASLILASDAPIGASLGSITRGEIRVLDDDSAGSIGFTSNRFEGTEGSEVALELRRVDGTAGRIVALVRLLGGTATVGQDYLGAVLTVEFLPGQTRKVVKLDWVDDSVVEGKESVNATLEIGTGSAVGSGLMVQGASTVIEVGDDDLPPASNSAPVATGVAPGASLTVMAGTSTQLTLQGYDAENSPLSFLRVTAPTKGVLTGQAPNLVYTANLGAVGTDRFTYKVNDGQLDSALATVTIAITSFNRSPVAVSQSVTLNEDMSALVSLLATDPDGDPLLFTVLNKPLLGTLSGNPPNLLYTPNPDVSGSDQIVFRVSDGRFESAVATVSLSIAPVNDAPVIAKVPDQRVTEGQAFDWNLVATDTDQPAQTISYSLVTGPQGLAVSPSGRVTWRPLEEQGPATYTVTVRASDGISAGELTFQITVLEVNEDPIWLQPEDVVVRESEPFSVRLRALDQDLPYQSIRYLLLSAPVGATLSEDGIFSWTPSERQGPSTHVVRVAATDGQSDVSTSFTIRVQEVNQPPSFVGLSEVRITEGSPYSQVLLATDADVPLQGISFRWIDGPPGSGVTNGVFYWVPGAVSRDTAYTVGVAVSDGETSVTNRFSLVVTRSSGSPYFVGLSNAAIPEGQPYQQLLRADHPQLPEDRLILRLVSGPAGSSLQGNVFRWTPSETQGPSTNGVLVSVSDGVTVVTNGFTLLVAEVNRVPVFAGLTNAVVPEGSTYAQGIRVSDPDLPVQMLNFRLVSGPAGARIVGTNFVWTPSEAQGPDSQLVRISVSDGVDSVTNAFTVTVREVPTSPSLAALLPREIAESVPFLWAIPGVDEDLPAQTLSYRLLEGPSGSVLTNGVFAWTPDETLGGSSAVLKIAVSDGEFSATNTVVLSILEVNQPPVPTPLGTRRVNEGNLLSFTVGATDADLPAQRLSYSAVAAPAGVTVSSNGVVSWRPTEAQGPSTNAVLIRVTDDGKPVQSSTNVVEIVVREVNTAPSLAAMLPREIPESAPFVWVIPGVDSDVPAQTLSYRLLEGPSESVLTNGVFVWNPDETLGGSSAVLKIAVSDGDLSVTNSVVLSILEVNQPPVPTPLGTRRVNEGNLLSFTVGATDADLPAQRLSYSAVAAPAGVTVSSNGVVSWRPTEAQGPSTNVVLIRVSDDGRPALSATNAIQIVVNEVNAAPILEGVTNRTVKLPGSVSLALRATDTDLPSQALTYGLVSGPNGLTVSSTGELRWTPTEAQARSTNQVTVSVSDGVTSSSTGFVVVVEASPRLSLQVTGGNSVVIQVAGPAGSLCRLEQADSPLGPWTAVVGVADLVTQGFSTPVPITLPGPLQTGRLYRLRVL